MPCHTMTYLPDIPHSKDCPTYRTEWYLYRCHLQLEMATLDMQLVIRRAIEKLEADLERFA